MEMVNLKSSVIPYTISKNINGNMSILIQNGEVIVKVPWYLKREKINEIIEKKKNWILDKIKEYQDIMVKENKAVKLLGAYYFFQINIFLYLKL